MSTTIRSFLELVDTLVAEKVPHSVNAEKQMLKLRTASDALPHDLLVRWEALLPFVQLMQPMIENVPEDRVRDIETAIVRINCISTFAGLEYDHASRMIYFRITMSVLQDGIRTDMFQAYLHGAVHDAKRLLPVMRSVVDGTIEGRDVLSHVGVGRSN